MNCIILFVSGVIGKPNSILSSQLSDLCKQFGLTSDDIDKEVSDEHILECDFQLEEWELVAAYLGLTRADIQAIEHPDEPDEEEMRLYILQKWKTKKSHGAAAYHVLLKALIKCECKESAEQLCSKYLH